MSKTQEFYVAFSIHGTNAFITANRHIEKTLIDKITDTDGTIHIDGFDFKKGYSRTSSLHGAQKLLWDELKDIKNKPLTVPIRVQAAFERLRDKGWTVDDKAFMKKHNLKPIETKVEQIQNPGNFMNQDPQKFSKELLPEPGSVDDGTMAGNESEKELAKLHENNHDDDYDVHGVIDMTKEDREAARMELYQRAIAPAFENLDGSVNFVKGDITLIPADVIVNAANSQLLVGGGVDGALNRVAGPALAEHMKKLNGCETGKAKPTLAFSLPAKYVVHAVGPVYKDYAAIRAAGLLSSAYKHAFEEAHKLGAKTVTCPLLSTGVYGYPLESACRIAYKAARQFNAAQKDRSLDITFVAFDDKALAALEKAKATVKL